MLEPLNLYYIVSLQHMWPPLILQFDLNKLFSCQLLSILNFVKSRLLWPSFQVRFSTSWCLDCAACAMMEYITDILFFFTFQCKCRNAQVFDIIIWLNHVYSLLGSKIQVLLLKHLSQIPVHIPLKTLTLCSCKNKPVTSGKIFLASERT